jgi:hypothetical protein
MHRGQKGRVTRRVAARAGVAGGVWLWTPVLGVATDGGESSLLHIGTLRCSTSTMLVSHDDVLVVNCKTNKNSGRPN